MKIILIDDDESVRLISKIHLERDHSFMTACIASEICKNMKWFTS